MDLDGTFRRRACQSSGLRVSPQGDTSRLELDRELQFEKCVTNPAPSLFPDMHSFTMQTRVLSSASMYR